MKEEKSCFNTCVSEKFIYIEEKVWLSVGPFFTSKSRGIFFAGILKGKIAEEFRGG